MAVAKHWHSDFLWGNTQRSYPLLDGTSGLDKTGAFQLPASFLVDASIPLRESGTSPARLYIRRIASWPDGFLVFFALPDGEEVASATVTISEHIFARQVPVTGLDADSPVHRGTLGVGLLEEIQNQPSGVWHFEPEATMLQPRCVIPTLPASPGVRVRSGGVLSELLTGTVILEPGANVNFRLEDNTIWLDAVGDEDFTADCECTGERAEGDPIRTINGEGPDAQGNFTLQAGRDCLEIVGVEHGLRFEDACSSPCCGCEELEAIQEALRFLQTQQTTMATHTERLNRQVEHMQTVVTSSPLYTG